MGVLLSLDVPHTRAATAAITAKPCAPATSAAAAATAAAAAVSAAAGEAYEDLQPFRYALSQPSSSSSNSNNNSGSNCCCICCCHAFTQPLGSLGEQPRCFILPTAAELSAGLIA